MRARARSAAVAAALAATLLGLSGCMTVHGETAVVVAATESEAERALKRYVTVTNRARAAYDARLAGSVQRGVLGETQRASLTAHRAVAPDGDPGHEPLRLSDTDFHIPRQAGWPKFFLADSAVEGAGGARHLLVFTREAVDEEWRAAYLAVVAAERVPAFATDADGHAEEVPDGGGDLLVAPAALGAAYASFLRDGEGEVFAAGEHTTGRREHRAERANRPAARNEWSDAAADAERYPPVGLYTRDGGALVFFATQHHTRQTVADGYRPTVEPLVEPLLKGEAERSLTQYHLAQQLVSVPAAPAAGAGGDGGRVEFLDLRSGLISAEGG
ncbi:hypothetical protein V1J52_10355 [Streptomyces sp. TRM 70351]|uniref:hypothetical protein n=1 Tax=Streptomyces sp. TRM 70351 TaxID=3116552 RepID=UPI002E7B5BF0|nr:hypothetical protein [Streptomyces sp. TRM 70351]MEE1928590.1 hypothetical protein [Streptomyces sp. TRM 70351]